MNYSKFCNEAKLVDDQTLKRAQVDLAFVAVNFDDDQVEGNPQRAICRYEFMEMLVRLAASKYIKDKKSEMTHAEALDKFISEDLLKHYTLPPWQEFRDKELWTKEVDSVIRLNLGNINSLHSRLTAIPDDQSGHKQYKAISDMVMGDTPVELTAAEAAFCFGMSKMTLV